MGHVLQLQPCPCAGAVGSRCPGWQGVLAYGQSLARALRGASPLPNPSQQPLLWPMLLLHLHLQGAARCLPPPSSLLGMGTPTARHGRSPWVLWAAGCQLPWMCLPSTTVQSPQMTLTEQPWAGAKPQPWSIPWRPSALALAPAPAQEQAVAMPHTRLGTQLLDPGPCVHGAGAVGPSMVLPTCPFLTGAQCKGTQRSPQAWWSLPIPWVLGSMSSDELQPVLARLGAMGGGEKGQGVQLAEGTAGADVP